MGTIKPLESADLSRAGTAAASDAGARLANQPDTSRSGASSSSAATGSPTTFR